MPKRRFEDEYDDEDGEPSDSSFTLSKGLAIIAFVFWALLLVAILVGLLAFWSALGKAQNAIGEAAVSAMFAVMFIAAYILTRCVEKLSIAIERYRAKPRP